MSDNIISNLIKGGLKKIKGKPNPLKKYNISWLQMRVLKNLPESKENKISFLGKELTFFGRTGFLHALDELFSKEIYKIQLPKDAFIIDCGSHIGLSVIYFKYHFPHSTIIAFEPDEQNFVYLKQNVNSYQLQNVEIKKEAVWIEDTTLSFANEGSMASKLSASGSSKVKATRLKNLLNKKVDLLKIDIEGAEYEVMKDIKDELKNVDHLFVEYHGSFGQNNELIEIFQIINAGGLSFYIQEAAPVYPHPFMNKSKAAPTAYDVQLNIFCFRQQA